VELSRLSRAIAARWLTVSLITLLGVVGALAFTMIANQNQATLWEAQAALRLQPEEGEEVADLAGRLDEAEAIARQSASELLSADSTSEILQDLRSGRLLFVAQDVSSEAADVKAQALLQAYLDVDPTIGGSVDDALAAASTEAEAIQAQIDDLRGPEPGPNAGADADLLDAYIGAIRGRLSTIIVEEAGATVEERIDLVSEREALEASLETLQAERTLAEAEPTVDLSVEETLLLATLERRMELLQAEYERLYLRKLGVTGQGTIEPVVLADLTPEPQSPVVNGAIGLIGGFLIAVTALIFISRARQTVWVAEDIVGNVLAEVPLRRVSPNTAEAWYDTAESSPRKTAIQALRSSVEALVPTSGAAIALTGLRVASEDVQALAADLGASVAISGSSVLLVDANFASSRAMGEYKVGGAALADVLHLDPHVPEYEAQIQHAAESPYLVRPGLAVVPSGPPPASPADALAGPQFKALVAAAQARYDYVFVVVDDATDPSAQVALQRLRHGILVLSPGGTTQPEVQSVRSDLQRLNIELLGTVFVGRHERFAMSRSGSAEPPSVSKPMPIQSEGVASSPISRLQGYAIPDERRTAVVPHSSLSELAGQLGAGDASGEGTARKLLLVLNRDSAASYAAVADYVVTRTADIVTAKFGFGDVSEELIARVAEDGFVTLRPVKDYRTAAAWLRHEIETEVDETTALELIDGIERVLIDGVDGASTLDGWLGKEFFRKHLRKTDGEPDVLHLGSPEGRVAVLVSTIRLDVELMLKLIEDVAAATTDELERFRAAAITRGDLEQAAIYDGELYDVYQFEQALRGIVFTESGRKRRRDSQKAWAPEWGLGKRANLAQIQDAGLFPFDVLSEEELGLQEATT
jgi:Mrp family chromosome partitioning ATPase